MAELVYGARLREDNPTVMSAFRVFFAGISVIHGMQQPPKRMLGFASLPDDKVARQQHLTL
jgi:hypothetical protein